MNIFVIISRYWLLCYNTVILLAVVFQIPSREVDKGEKKMWTQWNPQTKQFFLQFYFKENLKEAKAILREKQKQAVKAASKDKLPPGPPGLVLLFIVLISKVKTFICAFIPFFSCDPSYD